MGVGRGAAGGGQALAVGDADDGRRQRGRTDVQAAGRLHGDGEGDPLAGVVPAVEYEGVGQGAVAVVGIDQGERSEEHTSELQSLMRISYAVFCLKKKINTLYR